MKLVEKPVYRLPLMVLAMISLILALWAGLQRFGWAMPSLHRALPMAHGPLMISGFLGTLISLERAVALRRLWPYVAPVLTGAGGLMLACGIGGGAGPLLMTLGSLVLVVIFAVLLRQQNERFMQVMAAGAVALFVGNVWWLAGALVPQVVHWWLGFLILTIAGERLELSRMLRHEKVVERRFLVVAPAFVAGLVIASFAPDAGIRLTGLATILLALWLVMYDVARHTIRATDLTRYIAACLLSGYFWLATGGLLLLIYGQEMAGPVYDACLHAIFVGFVFSMIFGHAPIIFPSVMGVPVFYRPYFYAPLVLLHLSLILRVVADLAFLLDLRRWGGLGTALAIVLFLVGVVFAVATTKRENTLS